MSQGSTQLAARRSVLLRQRRPSERRRKRLDRPTRQQASDWAHAGVRNSPASVLDSRILVDGEEMKVPRKKQKDKSQEAGKPLGRRRRCQRYAYCFGWGEHKSG